MDYFILELHKAYIPPQLLSYSGILDMQSMKHQRAAYMPKQMIFFIKQHMQTVFTDILMHPCFMVSKEAKRIIEWYEPRLRFKSLQLFDEKKRISKRYFLPFLEEIDCLTEQSHCNPDKSVIYQAQVNGNEIKGKTLLKVANVNCSMILIRLDLAESLLRRDMCGVGLREVEVIYKN